MKTNKTTRSVSSFLLCSFLAASVFVSTGCGSDEGANGGLNACETSHNVADVLKDVEALAKLSKARSESGAPFTAAELETRYMVTQEASFKAPHHKDLVADLKQDQPRLTKNEFFAVVLEHASDEVARIIDQDLQPKIREVCEQHSVKYDPVKKEYIENTDECAVTRQETVKAEGYEEAILLRSQLGELYSMMSSGSAAFADPTALLAKIDEIRGNGIATYLSINCAIESAFAKLHGPARKGQKGFDGRGPKQVPSSLGGGSYERSVPQRTSGSATL